MKLPRDVSGDALAAVLCRRLGYVHVHQTGSHIILQSESPKHHRIAIPAHASLRVGTLNALLNSVAQAKGCDKAEVLGVVNRYL